VVVTYASAAYVTNEDTAPLRGRRVNLVLEDGEVVELPPSLAVRMSKQAEDNRVHVGIHIFFYRARLNPFPRIQKPDELAAHLGNIVPESLLVLTEPILYLSRAWASTTESFKACAIITTLETTICALQAVMPFNHAVKQLFARNAISGRVLPIFAASIG
jgi:hypothetical protein